MTGSAGKSSLLRASAIMASGTMVSRILGFVRSAMLIAAIGTAGGGVSAAFQTANTLPNTVFNLLASGVFDAVLVPQIVGALRRRHDGQTYVNRLLTLAGTLLFVVTIIAMIAAPLLVVITAAGYDSEIRTLAILFALLCLPQLFFYGLYNLLGELLNARGVFGPYMWAPVVNNVVGIAGLGAFLMLWGTADGRIDVADLSSAQFWLLGGSATLGVIAQALVLVIPMRRAKVRFTPDFHFRGTSFGSTSKVAGWTFATLGVSQIGVLSSSNLSALADAYAKAHNVLIPGILGSTTAFMVFMVPQSLITVSLTTAIFTRMANSVAEGDDRGVADSYHLGVKTITSLTLPAAAILMAGSVPMMQMAAYSESNQSLVVGYAWILAAFMPGVASTGMVLMSQRVFFAYEDVRPVFLMGIGPTIIQVIVGWSLYFLTGAAWWVAGAALAETVCRLVQGIIAVVWVSRRNSYVDRSMLLRSYAAFLVSAMIAGAVAFAVLNAVGVTTPIDSSIVRFTIATLKLVMVSVVTSLVYMLVLRVISPEQSALTIAPLLARLRVPARLRAILAAPVAQTPAKAGIMAEVDSSSMEGDMNEDEELMPVDPLASDSDESAEPVDRDALIRSLESHSSTSQDQTLLSFDEVLARNGDSLADDGGALPPPPPMPPMPPAPDEPVDGARPVEAPEAAPAGAVPSFDEIVDEGAATGAGAQGASAWFAAAGASLSAWALKAREGASQMAAKTKASLEEATAKARASSQADFANKPPAQEPSPDALDDMPPLPQAEDAPPHDDLDLTADALPAVKASGDDAAATSIPLPLSGIPAPPPPSEDDLADEELTATVDVPVVAPRSFDEATRAADTAPNDAPSGDAPVYSADGHRLIDPTKPTLIFAIAITVVGAIWAVNTALAPVGEIDLAQSLASAASTSAQSGDEEPVAEPEPTDVVAPQITAVSVLSWSDDNGDHPETAVNMIDGDGSTSWHSRYYEYNQFADDSNVTILIKLEQEATVSSVTLEMDPSTSGGEVVVRNVTDTSDPRSGTEVTTSALSPTTTITLPEPVTTSAIALSFRTMPTSVDGQSWAWVYELSVN